MTKDGKKQIRTFTDLRVYVDQNKKSRNGTGANKAPLLQSGKTRAKRKKMHRCVKFIAIHSQLESIVEERTVTSDIQIEFESDDEEEKTVNTDSSDEPHFPKKNYIKKATNKIYSVVNKGRFIAAKTLLPQSSQTHRKLINIPRNMLISLLEVLRKESEENRSLLCHSANPTPSLPTSKMPFFYSIINCGVIHASLPQIGPFFGKWTECIWIHCHPAVLILMECVVNSESNQLDLALKYAVDLNTEEVMKRMKRNDIEKKKIEAIPEKYFIRYKMSAVTSSRKIRNREIHMFNLERITFSGINTQVKFFSYDSNEMNILRMIISNATS